MPRKIRTQLEIECADASLPDAIRACVEGIGVVAQELVVCDGQLPVVVVVAVGSLVDVFRAVYQQLVDKLQEERANDASK